MRKFYLLNDTGVQFDLRTNSLHPLTNVSNLGLTFSYEYVDVGQSFIRTKKSNSMLKPSGTIIFYEGYKGYDDFCAYIESSSKLYLYYGYQNNNFVFCEVELESIQRTELKANTLQCSVTFNKLTPFKKKRSLETTTAVAMPQKAKDNNVAVEGLTQVYYLEFEAETFREAPCKIVFDITTSSGITLTYAAGVYNNPNAHKVSTSVYKPLNKGYQITIDSTGEKKKIFASNHTDIFKDQIGKTTGFHNGIDGYFPRINKGVNYIYCDASKTDVKGLKVEWEEVLE